MGRKNYKTKQHRRNNRVEYVIEDMRGDYEVTMSNGSGFKTVVVNGTSVSCWNWCIRAGMEKGGDLEGYIPREIKPLGANQATFSVI